MGQCMVVLQSSYTGYTNNTTTLHINQMPPNPAIFAPGPALLFVIVKGVSSISVHVMIGLGHIEEQKPFPVGSAPLSSIIEVVPSANSLNAALNGGLYPLPLILVGVHWSPPNSTGLHWTPVKSIMAQEHPQILSPMGVHFIFHPEIGQSPPETSTRVQ